MIIPTHNKWLLDFLDKFKAAGVPKMAFLKDVYKDTTDENLKAIIMAQVLGGKGD